MPILSLHGKTAEQLNVVSLEMLESLWARAMRQLEIVEKREVLLSKQLAWLEANKGASGWGLANEQHQRLLDEWIDVMIEEWYTRVGAFERAAKGQDRKLLDLVHERAHEGSWGLHGLRAERAKALGLVIGASHVAHELPF